MKFMRTVKKGLTYALLLALLAAPLAIVSPLGGTAAAATPQSKADCQPGQTFLKNPNRCVSSQSAIDPGNLPEVPASAGKIRQIKDIVFAIIGGLVLLILTVSGLRYVTSAGDPQKATTARNGIIFALIGLAVALAADAIVSYVVANL